MEYAGLRGITVQLGIWQKQRVYGPTPAGYMVLCITAVRYIDKIDYLEYLKWFQHLFSALSIQPYPLRLLGPGLSDNKLTHTAAVPT